MDILDVEMKYDGIIETIASALHLPKESKQQILDMSPEKKIKALGDLQRAYHSVRFESWTASKSGSYDWSAYNQCTICLHIRGIVKGYETAVLYLTIGRYNPRTLHAHQRTGVRQQGPDVRFLLRSSIANKLGKYQNATQFIELVSEIKDRKDRKDPQFLTLNVYDPGTEALNETENSKHMLQYHIPYIYQKNDESDRVNQAKILKKFLREYSTKIGQPVKRERLNGYATEQLYRASRSVPQMTRETAGVLLHKELHGKDDVMRLIMDHIH